MTIPLVIYVDVDDTLVRSVGATRMPIPRVVDHVRELSAAGAELYCWSSGGAAYARETARELAIEDCFKGFLPKPAVMIDDQRLADWRRLIEINPFETSGKGLSDYERLLAGR